MSPSLAFRLVLAVAAALVLLAVGQGSGPVLAATPVYADGAGACNGLTPCFTTIQEAVDNAGPAPAVVNVFPGTYAESVDLSQMGSAIEDGPGDISLITVNASGAPTAGTATINPPSGDAIGHSIAPFPGSITINGFSVTSPDDSGIDLETDSGAVTITGVTANGNFFEGVDVDTDTGNISATGVTTNGNDDNGLDLQTASGDINVTDSVASNNSFSGIHADTGSGTVTINGATANDNGDEGIQTRSDASATVTGATANGNSDDGIDMEGGGDATITDSTSNGNEDEGIEIDVDGNVLLDGVTANNNEDDGVDLEAYEDSLASASVKNSVFMGNFDGAIDLDTSSVSASGGYAATGNIVCQNPDGLESDADISIDATATWWGSASGPTHPNNPSGTGDPVRDGAAGFAGTVDFDPWIDTISGSAGAATVGVPVVVSFQFTDTSVALTEGPGDPGGAPTFTAASNNGTVATSGFISGGKLSVTLTPASVGTATVTVTGPCGLDTSLSGATIVLNVAAAPAAPAPTQVPTVLPPLGGAEPAGGGAGAGWGAVVLALVAALGAVAAGALVLRRRTR